VSAARPVSGGPLGARPVEVELEAEAGAAANAARDPTPAIIATVASVTSAGDRALT
jgi:hypothetical protein